ncbi:MAG: hypothetical protein WBJ12_06840, partial [Dethiobacteria bacterium]
PCAKPYLSIVFKERKWLVNAILKAPGDHHRVLPGPETFQHNRVFLTATPSPAACCRYFVAGSSLQTSPGKIESKSGHLDELLSPAGLKVILTLQYALSLYNIKSRDSQIIFI